MVLIPDHCVHRCNPVAGGVRSYYMLYLERTWFETTLSRVTDGLQPMVNAGLSLGQFQPQIFASPSLFDLFMDFTEALIAQNLAYAQDLITQFVQRLGPAIMGTTEIVHPAKIVSIKDVLHDNMAAPVSLAALSALLHKRPETLIRQFKQHMGITPKAYINNIRVEAAKRQLRAGHAILEVSYDLGFSDPSHFHKTFRNYSAQSPKQYRNNR